MNESLDEADALAVLLSRWGYDPADVHALCLCLTEALANARKHGRPPLTVGFSVGEGEASCRVRDWGAGFDPQAVPDCTLPSNLAKEGGRGIHLIRSFSDWCEWRDGGREVSFGRKRVRERAAGG